MSGPVCIPAEFFYAEGFAAERRGRKQSDGSWMAYRPADSNDSPLLKIEEKDGKVLVQCLHGCSQEKVFDALGQLEQWKRWKELQERPEEPPASVSMASEPHSTHAESSPASAPSTVQTSSPSVGTIADALGGRKSGDGWIACCPAHEDNNPSLSIQERDGKVLLHCFAGCSQEKVLDVLRQRGLWRAKPQAGVSTASKPHPTHAASPPATRSPQALWERYSPASPSHPYLTGKRIGTHGARAVPGQSTLAIPLTDTEGAIHGLQYISADGTKRFLSGSTVKGHFFLVGSTKNLEPLYVAEGFATAASIHEVTGIQVAVAFNAANLEPAAKALHRKWPEREIVICADDDAKGNGNPGLANAHRAAQAVGGKVAIPDFGAQRPEGATDFNDLFIHCGPEAVTGSIQNAKGVFQALEDLVEQSIGDPGYAFEPDVVEQLKVLKRSHHDRYESVRSALKAKTKCRVTQLDKAIDTGNEQGDGGGKAGMADQLATLAGDELNNWEDIFVSDQDDGFNQAFAILQSMATVKPGRLPVFVSRNG